MATDVDVDAGPGRPAAGSAVGHAEVTVSHRKPRSKTCLGFCFLISDAMMDELTAAAITVVEELVEDEEEEEERYDHELLSGGGQDIVPIVLQVSTHRRQKIPRLDGYLDIVAKYSDDDFRKRFRLTRRTFHILLELLEEAPGEHVAQPGAGRPVCPLETQVLVFLCFLSSQETYASIADRFNMGVATVHAIVRRGAHALCQLQDRLISLPRGYRQAGRTADGFQELCGVPGILGAIDGSHIRVKPPMDDEQSYYNRKKYHSIILQAVANSEYVFTDIYAGWPGSTHDSRVLRNSPLFQRAEHSYVHTFPGNTFLIADPAYASRRWIAPTLKKNAAATAQQRRYSTAIAKGRVVIEQAFGILKARWRRLKYLECDVEFASILIASACVLHNVCMLQHEDYDDFLQEEHEDEDDDVGDEPILPPQAGGAALIQHLTDVINALPAQQ